MVQRDKVATSVCRHSSGEMNLIITFLHVTMVSVFSGGSAEVVSDFRGKCAEFFANGISPTILPEPQYKKICQTLKGKVHYATLYNTYKKIPVYSAYKFNKRISCERKKSWCIEPQLDDAGEGPNMVPEPFRQSDNQAVSDDYKDSGYDKGHLAPVFLAGSQGCADATFTLTNAAPQNPSFNRGQWRILEEKIAKELNERCLLKKNTAYIVTGVVPRRRKIPRILNVPSHFWTAYCCLDHNKECHISRGFIGENKNVTPNNITVNELERMLEKLYKVTSFKLFNTQTN
ncbi:endonuclease domain-containing 1 protein-like [Labeo rohita]|uniref:endonuclease domain-containing 1 protein-like n=1 Tax=Labeo rohita TaxID=84645 RepID=UPI0021E1CCFC|nr:endonuclease domain-containing 1 protein-like [Labeo rohita]